MSTSNPPGGIAFVTGGTGLLGSHIAERLRDRGTTVRALCRSGSDTRFLESIGAIILPGDLTDRAALRRGCDGADVVYHAAARVGDWGPWDEFVRFSIDGTRLLLDAAADTGVSRFLHISSISVYGHVNGEGKVFDESAPLGVDLGKWSYYSRAKVEAERLVWDAHRAQRVQATVIRPSWMYGLRDRATMPRLVDNLARGKVKLIGNGDNRLNVTNAANVADGAVLAAASDRAVGEAYNICHDGVITQRQYFDRIAAAAGAPPVTRRVPYGVARRAAFLMECWGHLFRTRKPPLVTRYALWLMGRRCFFECEKIKRDLGWSSRVNYDDGIPAAVAECLGRRAGDRGGGSDLAPHRASAVPAAR